MVATSAMAKNASPASVVAGVIFKAATDQLSYTTGEDAKMLTANCQQYDDPAFIGSIKSQFSL
ncbi:hypothetical protein ACFGVS_25825 [Mucilaginibacter sp. AW1-7]|uniref:hypothetical protein n=1 Tax=Mucilaginibacter sp. AW1-7 TaxID=3349874 RepID=UPI003F741125